MNLVYVIFHIGTTTTPNASVLGERMQEVASTGGVDLNEKCR